MEQTLLVNEKEYKLIKMLGKGKGGYSLGDGGRVIRSRCSRRVSRVTLVPLPLMWSGKRYFCVSMAMASGSWISMSGSW